MKQNNKPVHAFTDDALGTMDATAVAQTIQRGELSAQEVCDAAIARTQTVNPHLNAVAYEQFALAASQAKHLQKGFFAAVPFFIKDNLSVQGLPMRQGSQALPARLQRSNDPLVNAMLAMGFNLLGKSNMPEMGLNCSTEYADGTYAANPWNTQYTAGGSSGGAAALVASGAVPIAHGNDGGGSLRLPAAMCGLFSLKCTRGRHVQTNLSRPLPLNIISDGVLTRSVRDCANFFMQLEKQYQAPKMPKLGDVSAPSDKRLLIGVMQESFNGYPLDADTQRVLTQTVKHLENLGHKIDIVRPVSKPEHAHAFMLYFAFLAFSLSRLGRSLYGEGFDRHKLDSYTKGLSRHFLRQSYKSAYYIWQGFGVRKNFYQQMRQYDVLLSPVLTEVTPKAGYLSPTVEFSSLVSRMTNLASFSALHNVMGTPSMSVPLGLSNASASSPNLPIGMQFSANFGEDKKLLQLAFELEQAVGFTQIYAQN